MLTGFLCGYPMGSKTAADLTRAGRISLEEGQYLLSFCNNTSPMFVLGFVAVQCLQAPALAPLSLLLLWVPPLLLSFLFRPRKSRCHSGKYSIDLRSSAPAKGRKFPGELPDGMDSAIMDGFTAITRIGGYIILFSILIQLMRLLPFRGSLPFQVAAVLPGSHKRRRPDRKPSSFFSGQVLALYGDGLLWRLVLRGPDPEHDPGKRSLHFPLYHTKTGHRNGDQSVIFSYAFILSV